MTVDATPIHLANGVYRYLVSGTYATGPVTVAFAAGKVTDSRGHTNAASTETFTVLGPTAALADPASNSTASPNTLNLEGYLDVAFTAPAGKTIDSSTITDAGAEFTLSGTGTAGWSLDTTMAPILVSTNGNTSVYRYWTTGAYTSGTVSITFIPGSYGFTDGTTSTFTGPVSPQSFTVDGVATPNVHYLDVLLTPTSGDSLTLSTITDSTPEFTLTGAGVGTVELLADAAPTALPGTSDFRYYVAGQFAAGEVDVGFIANSFASGAYTNLARTDKFTLGQLTAAVVDPNAGGITGLGTVNGRGFVDVTFDVPAGADSLDISSITDAAPEFTIAAANPANGTIALDTTQAPIRIGTTGYTFRYFTTGTMESGAVTLTYLPGSVSSLSAAGQATAVGANVSASVTSKALTSNVATLTTATDPALTVGDSVTITGVDSTFNGTYTVTAVTATTFSYALTHADVAAATATGTVSHVAGSLTLSGVFNGDSYVDVEFTPVGNVPLGFSSTNAPPSFTLSGSGAGNAAIDSATAPTISSEDVALVTGKSLSGNFATLTTSTTSGFSVGDTVVVAGVDSIFDGTFTITAVSPTTFSYALTHADVGAAPATGTAASGAGPEIVRYYLTGQFSAGTVNVAFAAGSWHDTALDAGTAATDSFKLIDELQAPGDAGASPNRVFFISLSGGVNLQAGGLFGDTPDEPLLAIRGAVELDIGTVTQPDGSTLVRFELTASGTVSVIKLGNIASGAATFILQTTTDLSSVEFWGVAAVQTNFDFLQQYGIFLSGSALIEINTTDATKTETLSLEGIPGGPIFAISNANYAADVAALPSDTFNKVALSSVWTNLFANPGTDRNIDGQADGSGPLTIEYGTGQVYTFENFAGLTLQNAQVEGVVAGKEWKILNGDGRQYFVQTEFDANGNQILVVSGEQRTFQLAPLSFEIEVIGSMNLYDPSTLSSSSPTLWVHMDGGFQLKITATQTTFFFTAGGSIVPLAISGRMTGLLILSYSATNGGIPGIAGLFDVDIGVGTPPSGNSGSSDLGDISGIFSFQGKVRVTLNTTLADQVFQVPPEFLAVVPSGFPSTLTIPASAPEIDGSRSANLNSTGIYIQAIVTGTIILADVITLTGTIAITLQVGTPSFIRIQGAVSTTIQYLGTLSGSIDMARYTSFPTDPSNAPDPGIIGRASLALDSSEIPGVSIGGNFLLEVNLFLLTSADASTVTFITKGEDGEACTGDECGLLATNPDGSLKTGTVTIHNGIRLLLDGHMTIANLVTIDGAFTFTFSEDPFVIQVTAVASIGLQGLGTLGSGGIQFQGAFRIDSDGISLFVSIGAGAFGDFGGNIGLGFSASATLTFTTASYTKTITDPLGNTFTIPSGFLLSIQGGVDFLGIVQANGSVAIAINASSFTLDFNIDISLGPIDLQASGFAGVYITPGHAGLVLQLDVSINFNILNIVKITGDGQIRLNTTPDSHTANGVTMGAHSFELYINGTVSLLDVIKVQTTVLVVVGGDVHLQGGSGDTAYNETVGEGDWFFLFSGDADFFGLATLHASGWVDSSGHFGVDLNGGITIGSSSFGLSGNFDVHAWLNELPCSAATADQQNAYCQGFSSGQYYTFGVAFSASVSVNAFGFSLASIGIGARLTASGSGTVDLVAEVSFSISFLFFSVSFTAHFDIGTVQLPHPIYLAGDACVPANPGCNPQAAADRDWTATATNTEPIYVNVGGREDGRNLGDDQPNESVTIDHISGDPTAPGGEKVQITMFGHQQTFDHVTAIYASTGAGDDTIIVDRGVLSPVFLSGGDGNDTILYDGSGGATIDGGAGNDVIQIGPDAGGPIVVTGGPGQDYLTDTSSDPGVSLDGGADSDTIIGGTGAGDILSGGSGDDVIKSNGPSDTISGGSGNDTIILTSLPTGAFPTISGGGDGGDVLAITGSAGADSVTVSKPQTGQDLELDVTKANGQTVNGSLKATGIHELDLNLAGGADHVTVGNLQDSSVVLTSIDTGASDRAADAVTIGGGSGDDTFTLSGSDPAAGIEIVHTVAGDTWVGQTYV